MAVLYDFAFTLAQHRNDDLLPRLAGMFGGTFHPGYRDKLIPHWRIHGRSSQRFLKSVLPFLRLKQRDAQIALEFLDTVLDGGIQLTLESRRVQEKCYMDMMSVRDARKTQRY